LLQSESQSWQPAGSTTACLQIYVPDLNLELTSQDDLLNLNDHENVINLSVASLCVKYSDRKSLDESLRLLGIDPGPEGIPVDPNAFEDIDLNKFPEFENNLNQLTETYARLIRVCM
jgi:hypothetical protein